MPVKIIIKKKFQFSNKPQPTPEPEPSEELFPTLLSLSDGKKVRVSVPVPDGLVTIIEIVPEIFGPTAHSAATVAEWVHSAGHYLKSEPFNTQYADDHYVPKKDPHVPLEDQKGWYKHVTLRMGPRGSTVRFEFLKATVKHPARLRISFNPRKLMRSGFEKLVQILSDPIGPFLIKPMLQTARVSRLDFAVDLVGLQTSEIVAFHPKQGKRSMYIGEDGVLETINIHRKVFSSKPSGNAFVRIYDRVRERLDHGKLPPFGPAPVTRVEVTKALKKPHNRLADILLFNDPFEHLRVGYVGDQMAPSAGWATYHSLLRTVPRETAEDFLGITKDTSSGFVKAMKVPNAPIVAKGVNWPGWEQGVHLTGLNLLLEAGK
ncbi:MAG: hypothetical protein ING71_16475 [Rhodocyclaceae bacterium]|nr:hypothetical protein [Rhodocyclaceae bacterium]